MATTTPFPGCGGAGGGPGGGDSGGPSGGGSGGGTGTTMAMASTRALARRWQETVEAQEAPILMSPKDKWAAPTLGTLDQDQQDILTTTTLQVYNT